VDKGSEEKTCVFKHENYDCKNKSLNYSGASRLHCKYKTVRFEKPAAKSARINFNEFR
jgi:hypothetical protein